MNPRLPLAWSYVLMQRTSRFRFLMLASFAFLPSFIKRPSYRLFFGYRIGKRVKIGLSIIDAGQCEISMMCRLATQRDHSRGRFENQDHTRIGHLNIIRGGDEVSRWGAIPRSCG